MAKSLALINKDIIQHYKLQNLLSPPEAKELTKVYDELSTILDKPTAPKKEPELDHYYKLLFKFMKLLHVLKFGTETQQQDDETKQKEGIEEEEEKEKEEEEDPRKTLAAKRKRIRFTNISPEFSPTTPAATETKKFIIEPTLPEEDSKPPAKPLIPTGSELDKIFEFHIPENSPHHAEALDIVKLLHAKYNDIKIIPGYKRDQDEIQIAGRLYNVKQVSNILKNLQIPDGFDINNLDDDYKQLFTRVLRPTIENHAEPALQAALHGFNSFLVNETARQKRKPLNIESTAIAIPAATTKVTTRSKHHGKGLGKIHLKRWQNHIR
jgi:hypothetical protein